MANIANPLPYITKREYGTLPDLKAKLFDNRLRAAKDLYRKDLVTHYGCVNAIEFSNDGELLISGGDDKRVMLWQFGQAIVDRGKPEPMKTIHEANIFCLGISHDKRKIFSGGNDCIVLVHDIETKLPIELLRHHRTVCCLSVDPFNSHMVTTAGMDGRLLLFDTRQSVHESLVIARSRKPFHGVMFHPLQQGLLASAHARDGVSLWDLKSPKYPVIRYSGNHGTLQNSMSVAFNRAGTHVLALRRRLAPVLYEIHSADAVAEFYHPDYYNSCTIKSCGFAGEDDGYVISGSDDFNIYMWKVPEIGSDSVVVDEPHVVLHGHRSIVNQVRFNAQYSLIASSGVEKIVKLWSTMEYPLMRGALLQQGAGADQPREIYAHVDYTAQGTDTGRVPFPYTFRHDNTNQSTREDPSLMAYFDTLVQRELESLAEDSCDTLATMLQSSSEEEHILTNFVPFVLPSKIARPNGTRSQRCPNRMARTVSSASRYPKNTRCQKTCSLGRTKNMDRRVLLSKFKMLPTARASGKGARSRSAARGLRASSAAASSQASSQVSSAGDSFAALNRSCTALFRSMYGSAPFATPGSVPEPIIGPVPENVFGSVPGAVFGRVHQAMFGRFDGPLRYPASMARDDRQTRRDEPSSDRSDSDEPSSSYRPEGRTRATRRRMALSRAIKRKNKTTFTKTIMDLRSSAMVQDCNNAMNFSNIDENYEATMSLPSTSTGYRGQSAPALFRITEVDSDDDQSVGSRPISPRNQSNPIIPHKPVSAFPTPINGSRNSLADSLDSIGDSLIVEPPESDNSNSPPGNRVKSNLRRGRRNGRPVQRSDSSDSPSPKPPSPTIIDPFIDYKPNYAPRPVQLLNDTNESEMETSSSEGSEPHTDAYLGLMTPDCVMGTVGDSSTPRPLPPEQVSGETDWQTVHRFRQRVRMARRNYKDRMGSDSNGSNE